MRKNLGNKNCELTAEHISEIQKAYLNFENIEEPFTFKSANGNLSSIASFGLKKNTSTDSKKIYQRKLKNNQVDVCYYDEKQGFIIRGVFDVRPELKGKPIKNIQIQMMDELEDFCKNHKVDIAALTIPKTAAQEVARKLARGRTMLAPDRGQPSRLQVII